MDVDFRSQFVDTLFDLIEDLSLVGFFLASIGNWQLGSHAQAEGLELDAFFLLSFLFDFDPCDRVTEQ